MAYLYNNTITSQNKKIFYIFAGVLHKVDFTCPVAQCSTPKPSPLKWSRYIYIIWGSLPYVKFDKIVKIYHNIY